jgi:hypothetical protein
MATPGVGEDIEDICTRCGDTWHVVMAKIGDRVVKVVCKLCGSQHNYRGEKNAQPTSAGKTGNSPWGRTRRRKAGRANNTPAPQVPDFDPSKPPRSYSPKQGFVPGERVIHATFGVGVVASTPGPGKVEVQFPGGLRTLACAKPGSTLERPVAVQNLAVPDSPSPKSGSGRA